MAGFQATVDRRMTNPKRLTKELVCQWLNSRKYCGDPGFREFTELDDDAAEMLAQYRVTELWLDGLTSLSNRAAEALAKQQGFILCLNGLTFLSDALAVALANHKGTVLFLGGVTSL